MQGDDSASLSWEKQGSDELPATSVIEGNRLTLSDITDEDGGVYRCNAATRVGPLSADAALNIGSRLLRKKKIRVRRTHPKQLIRVSQTRQELPKEPESGVFGSWFFSGKRTA